MHCLVCGYEWEKPHAGDLSNKSTFCHCPKCTNKIVIQGENDLATTHPHFIKYFKNKEDAKKVKFNSSCVKIFKCPDCGYEKENIVQLVTKRGFSCPICGDKISFPNKLIRNVLLMLEVDCFQPEYSPNWAKGYRYDAYFEKEGTPYLVEMDGALHFSNGFEGKKKR